MPNTLGVVIGLLNTRYINDMITLVHMSCLEAQFYRLTTMGSGTEQPMQIAVLLSLLNDWEENVFSIVSVHTLKEDTAI